MPADSAIASTLPGGPGKGSSPGKGLSPGKGWPPGKSWVRRGIVDALGIPSLVLGASMLAVGGLAHDVGYPLGAVLLSTLVIWAAPAQVILFGLIAAGATLPVMAIAVGFSSVRFLPMCMTILPLLRQPGTRTPTLLAASHLIAVTNWVESMRRLPPLPPPARLPYYFGFATTVMLCATAATGIGYYLVSRLPPLMAAGLLFVSPIYFTSALGRAARSRADVLAMASGFVLMPLSVWLPSGFDIIAVGVIGGTVAYAIDRLDRHRAKHALASDPERELP